MRTRRPTLRPSAAGFQPRGRRKNHHDRLDLIVAVFVLAGLGTAVLMLAVLAAGNLTTMIRQGVTGLGGGAGPSRFIADPGSGLGLPRDCRQPPSGESRDVADELGEQLDVQVVGAEGRNVVEGAAAGAHEGAGG